MMEKKNEISLEKNVRDFVISFHTKVMQYDFRYNPYINQTPDRENEIEPAFFRLRPKLANYGIKPPTIRT